jgi:hypothetical protein
MGWEWAEAFGQRMEESRFGLEGGEVEGPMGWEEPTMWLDGQGPDRLGEGPSLWPEDGGEPDRLGGGAAVWPEDTGAPDGLDGRPNVRPDDEGWLHGSGEGQSLWP